MQAYNHGAVVLPERIHGQRVTRICRSVRGRSYKDITALALPYGVQIEKEAFSDCTNLTEVVMGGTEQEYEIGAHCFDGCTKLMSVYLSSKVTYIGLAAFAGCGLLKHIVVEQGNPCYYTGAQGCVERETRTLIVGVNSEIVIVKNAVQHIGDYAFCNCSAIREIILPEGIKGIGYAAFSGCIGLESILIPTSVGLIDAFAFDGCKQLHTATFKKEKHWCILMEDDATNTAVLLNPAYNAKMLVNNCVRYRWVSEQ